MTNKKSLRKIRGGLSDSVFKSEIIQNYIKNEAFFGYIGELNRTIARDRIVESVLRERGLESRGIASWLTSTSGRHLMDDVDRKTTVEEFTNMVNESTEDAFINVTVWNHPDHNGSLSASLELKKKIIDWVNRKK